MRILKENRDLSKGIFWVKDIDDIENSILCFSVDCDKNGEVLSTNSLTSKSGISFNHKVTWSMLPSSITENKPFNYFPRGRVEIAHGKATVYCSKHIAFDELIDVCKEEFNLTFANGISKVRLVIDGSNHYKCYLDE